ncbi:uncharacterized protein LOC125760310 [Rhipicephalus sanguineus]|uniref:uncharacterized protein LOC125760310 n=1 Tax=Rhipicephalus sanguineus TaxID=34632 RepID=UPI0020C2D67C|nr:uncharacterized protein LOC125760310 [Rhipicephalus sanguineus]
MHRANQSVVLDAQVVGTRAALSEAYHVKRNKYLIPDLLKQVNQNSSAVVAAVTLSYHGTWARDSSYPLEACLLTPVPGRPAPGTPENHYNKAHTAMRTVVERCIGVLKSRFQSLQRYQTLLYNPDRAATIIAACAALHDIALAAHEPVLEGHDDDTDDVELLPAAADLPPPPQREPAAAQPRNEPASRTTGPACRAPAQSTPPPATTSAALCGGFRCNEGPGEGTNALQFVDHVTENLNLAQLSNDAWPCRLVFAASNSSALACRLPTSRSCGMSWKPRNVLPLSSINFLDSSLEAYVTTLAVNGTMCHSKPKS